MDELKKEIEEILIDIKINLWGGLSINDAADKILFLITRHESEKVCVWTPTNDIHGNGYYHTGCDMARSIRQVTPDDKLCPYCGSKIKREEHEYKD